MSAETSNLGERPSAPDIILPKECLTLPLVCQEGVRDVLGRLQRMEREGRWFKARSPEELTPIIPQVEEQAQGLFEALRPYKEDGLSWGVAQDTARDTARYTAWDVARGAVRDAARDVVRGAVRDVARDAVRDVARDAVRAAAWEVIKDRQGFEENPFAHYLSLYELGAAGVGFHSVEETAVNEEMLVVHFPLKLEGDRLVWACLAYPDGRPGDGEVRFVHSQGDNCSEITPLHPQRRIT